MSQVTNSKNTKQFGYKELMQKTFAIILSSLATLIQARSANIPTDLNSCDANDLNYNRYQQRALKPKLVLKLFSKDLSKGKIMMHTSHSSHSSHMSSSSSGHYSHSSHSSHSSHYSGSPVYVSPLPHVNSQHSNNTSSNSNTNPVISNNFSNNYIDSSAVNYILGSRKLFEGCRGNDVKELQHLLIKLSLLHIEDGYFGESTKFAVINFQKTNLLTADGIVGKITLAVIQAQAYAH